jgi:hypothetical protein
MAKVMRKEANVPRSNRADNSRPEAFIMGVLLYSQKIHKTKMVRRMPEILNN